MIVAISGEKQSWMKKLTFTKILIIVGTTCSVLKARAGLGYAASFSSDAQQTMFQKVSSPPRSFSP